MKNNIYYDYDKWKDIMGRGSYYLYVAVQAKKVVNNVGVFAIPFQFF